MANFKQHITGGFITGGITSTIALFGYGLTLLQAGVVFILGVLGSVLPDIDCDTSTPLKFLFGYIGIILPVIGLQYYPDAKMENTLIFIVIGYFLIRDVISILFLKITVHRGIYHSIPMAIIMGQLTYLMFFDSLFTHRIIFAIACCLGYLTHLTMDEIWSIDLTGCHIKRSFGTALTLKGESIIVTIIAYIAIISLAGIIYWTYS